MKLELELSEWSEDEISLPNSSSKLASLDVFYPSSFSKTNVETTDLFSLCDFDNREIIRNSNTMKRVEIIYKLERIVMDILSAIIKGTPPSIIVVNSFSNAEFNETTHRMSMKPTIYFQKITYHMNRNNRAFAAFIKIIDICHELLTKNVKATKRDVYYRDVKLFRNQATVDKAITMLACTLGVSRYQLNVTASSKGLLAGEITIHLVGDEKQSGSGENGILIPSVDSILLIETTCTKILVVEKEASFRNILQSGFVNKFPNFLLATGKGYPDIATRQFIKLMVDKLSVEVVGLFDCDPHGVDIFLCYRDGSKSQAFDSHELAVSTIKWVGLNCQDWQSSTNFEDVSIPLNSKDIKVGFSILKRRHLSGQKIAREVQKMLFTRRKTELQHLCDGDVNYFCNVFFEKKFSDTSLWI